MESNEETRYTIAEARDRFAALVHDVEDTSAIALTRRGKPVAVLVSYDRYRRLIGAQPGMWDRYQRFRERVDVAALGIADDVFDGVRDRSSGRDSTL